MFINHKDVGVYDHTMNILPVALIFGTGELVVHRIQIFHHCHADQSNSKPAPTAPVFDCIKDEMEILH